MLHTDLMLPILTFQTYHPDSEVEALTHDGPDSSQTYVKVSPVDNFMPEDNTSPAFETFRPKSSKSNSTGKKTITGTLVHSN